MKKALAMGIMTAALGMAQNLESGVGISRRERMAIARNLTGPVSSR